MSKPIWFPFYVNDFLSSPTVTLMTAEEVGGYTLLLCYAWQDPRGSLPVDENSLRKLSRVEGDLSRILTCFYEKKGRLYNARLTQELEKAHEKSASARKSNAMRWQNERNANVLRTQSSSQSQSQSELQSESESELQSELQKEKTSVALIELATGGTVNGVAAWNAYHEAYRLRYGVAPVRNQTTNSHLKQMVKRLGAGDAPLVAAFYLNHNEPFYVKARHPTSLLLRDCEGLRTQWATGIKATTGEAKNGEFKDNVVGQVQRVIANMKQKGTL